MLIVLLLLLAAVAAAALALLWLVVRGHNKRLLLAGSHAVASDTPGGIGYRCCAAASMRRSRSKTCFRPNMHTMR